MIFFLFDHKHMNYKQIIDCNLQRQNKNTMKFSFASGKNLSLVAIVYLDLY